MKGKEDKTKYRWMEWIFPYSYIGDTASLLWTQIVEAICCVGLLVCFFNDEFTLLAFIAAEESQKAWRECTLMALKSENKKKQHKVFLKPFPRFPWLMFF